MKKTRLLEIIREEISNALSERMPYLSGEKGAELSSELVKAANELAKQGYNAKEIASILKSKKKRPELAPDFDSALEKQADTYGGEPGYTFDLGGPQVQRAVDKALGNVPAKKEKSTSEPTEPSKKGRPTGTKNFQTKSIEPSSEEEIEAVGSEDEEWYGGEEEAGEEAPTPEKIKKASKGLESEFERVAGMKDLRSLLDDEDDF